MTRLFRLAAAYCCVALVLACAAPSRPSTGPGPSAGGLTFAQGVADAQGIVAALRAEAPLIAALYPQVLSATGAPGVTALSQVTNASGTGWLDLAGKELQGPVVSVAGLAAAEQDINLTLQALSAVAQGLASADPRIAAAAGVIDAAIALAPGIEALVNQAQAPAAVPGVASVRDAPAAALARAAAPHVSPEKARMVLESVR